MTETAFLKLFVAIVITFILVLPEFFKTPEERIHELSCLEVCFLPNFTYPLSSFNFSSVAFLQPAEETQTIMGILLNHSSFQSFAEICQGITSGLPMCSLCLVCESKGDVDFTSQEQTSKGLVMRGSKEVKASDLYSPSVTCSTKITWYVLVLFVFMLGIIFIIYKILEDHRRAWRRQSHKYKSSSVLLRGGDSAKLSTLDVRVIPESTQRLPLVRVMEALPPIPELEVTSAVHQQDQYTWLPLDNLD